MPRRLARRSRRMWLSAKLWARRLVFWSGAVCVGGVAILFALAGEYADTLFHKGIAFSPILPFIVTPLGLALVIAVTRRFFPGSEGSGIPQTIAALEMRDQQLRNEVLSLRIAGGKILLTFVGLLSGASIGREGPTVQIGASIMHALGRMVKFAQHDTERGLILAGGAAGVAAAFNTPLAGVVFAIEEMSRSFEQRTSGTVLTAVIVAGITSLHFLGNYTYFGHTSASLTDNRGWLAVILCGTVGGLLGGVFSRILITFARGVGGRLGLFMRERPVLFAASCGLVLALIGLASGNTTWGSGYAEAKRIVEGTSLPSESYGILKMLATIVSYVSGIPGGLFAPSLAVGAGFGANLSIWVPLAPAGAMVILGMAGYFAGVVQAPITTFVIVMEMTDNHDMVVPLMATSLIAYAASRLVCPEPIYKALAEGFLRKSAKGNQSAPSAGAGTAESGQPTP